MKPEAKTYEGRITIKWHKNDYGDVHPLTIDCQNEKELHQECNRIKKAFFSEKGLDGYDYPKQKAPLGGLGAVKPYSVTFDMTERI